MTDPENFLARVSDQPRFRGAIRRFDEANAADPNSEAAEGRAWPLKLPFGPRESDLVQRALHCQPPSV